MTTPDVMIRPARTEDLPAMAQLTSDSFHEVDVATFQRAWPDPEPRTPERNARWAARTAHALRTDPGGCWVAELDGEVVGVAISRVRELMWILSSFAVAGRLRGRGVGVQLFAAAAHHGRGCLRAILASSADPSAVRLYRRAGFDLHPQMLLTGTVDRAALPVVERVREGGTGDIDLLNSIDRQARGAAHLSDHEVLLGECRLLVTEQASGSGYAYVTADGEPTLLAATSRRTAADLMWEALAATTPGARVSIGHITAANAWAVDVGLEARLSVFTSGYLCVRGMKPPTPYLHHGSLL